MHKTENEIYLKKNLTLVGMPGCGKSTIGQICAEMCGLEFYDSDEIIENEQGCKISAIFSEKGETYFRKLESDAIIGKLNQQNKQFILSTGGGAMMTPDLCKYMLENSDVIFLNASIETLWQHIKEEHQSRPLLTNDGAPKDKLKALLDKRLSTYLLAHLTITCDDKTPEQIAQIIAKRLITNE